MKAPVVPLDSILRATRNSFACAIAALCLWSPPTARADQIEMQNGDRYIANVVSLNSNTLVVRNEVLGTVHLPRGKVASITFGRAATIPSVQSKTNAALAQPLSGLTNSTSEFAAALHQLGAQTNLIQQVQSEFLAGVGPEANNKFNELLNGLTTGKLTLGDLRNEAKSAADQLRALEKDLGDDSGFALDGYLSILDGFLSETAPADISQPAPARRSIVAPQSK